MLRVLIVDDEAPARAEMTFLLQQEALVEAVDDAASVKEAISKMVVDPPDVLMLDVQMPEVGGMKFAHALQNIKRPPCIVFVTAYPEYAIDAFGVEALDYLLKPVNADRLHQTLRKAMRARALQNYVLHGATPAKRVWVRGKEGKSYIDASAIDYIEASKDMIYVHVGQDQYEKSCSLLQFEKELPSTTFYRIRRNITVNTERISDCEINAEGMSITLGTKESSVRLLVARRRVSDLRRKMGMSK